jgi:hypothetical protein
MGIDIVTVLVNKDTHFSLTDRRIIFGVLSLQEMLIAVVGQQPFLDVTSMSIEQSAAIAAADIEVRKSPKELLLEVLQSPEKVVQGSGREPLTQAEYADVEALVGRTSLALGDPLFRMLPADALISLHDYAKTPVSDKIKRTILASEFQTAAKQVEELYYKKAA